MNRTSRRTNFSVSVKNKIQGYQNTIPPDLGLEQEQFPQPFDADAGQSNLCRKKLSMNLILNTHVKY